MPGADADTDAEMTQFKCFPLVLLPPKSLRAEYPGWDAQKTQESPRTGGSGRGARQHWIGQPQVSDPNRGWRTGDLLAEQLPLCLLELFVGENSANVEVGDPFEFFAR